MGLRGRKEFTLSHGRTVSTGRMCAEHGSIYIHDCIVHDIVVYEKTYMY